MTIDVAIRLDGDGQTGPLLNIQASDGTSRYALQQYLIDFKRIRILEQDYVLEGQQYPGPAAQEPQTPEPSARVGERLELAAMTQERDELAELVDQQRESLVAARRSNDRLRKELEGAEQRRDDAVEENYSLVERLEAYVGRYAELDREYGKAATERDELRKERDKLAGALDRLVIIVSQRRKEMKQLRQRIDELQVELAEARAELNEIVPEHQEMKLQLEAREKDADHIEKLERELRHRAEASPEAERNGVETVERMLGRDNAPPAQVQKWIRQGKHHESFRLGAWRALANALLLRLMASDKKLAQAKKQLEENGI